jgi:hypothetical protein
VLGCFEAEARVGAGDEVGFAGGGGGRGEEGEVVGLGGEGVHGGGRWWVRFGDVVDGVGVFALKGLEEESVAYR